MLREYKPANLLLVVNRISVGGHNITFVAVMQMKRIVLCKELNSTKEPYFFSDYILKDVCLDYKSIIIVKVIFSIEKSFYGRT